MNIMLKSPSRPSHVRESGSSHKQNPPRKPSAVRVEMTTFNYLDVSTTGVSLLPNTVRGDLANRRPVSPEVGMPVTTTGTVAGVEIGSETASKACITISILELKGQRPITSSGKCPPFYAS